MKDFCKSNAKHRDEIYVYFVSMSHLSDDNFIKKYIKVGNKLANYTDSRNLCINEYSVMYNFLIELSKYGDVL